MGSGRLLVPDWLRLVGSTVSAVTALLALVGGIFGAAAWVIDLYFVSENEAKVANATIVDQLRESSKAQTAATREVTSELRETNKAIQALNGELQHLRGRVDAVHRMVREP